MLYSIYAWDDPQIVVMRRSSSFANDSSSRAKNRCWPADMKCVQGGDDVRVGWLTLTQHAADVRQRRASEIKFGAWWSGWESGNMACCGWQISPISQCWKKNNKVKIIGSNKKETVHTDSQTQGWAHGFKRRTHDISGMHFQVCYVPYPGYETWYQSKSQVMSSPNIKLKSVWYPLVKPFTDSCIICNSAI